MAGGAGAETVTQITGIICVVGAVVAYILAEAAVDKAREQSKTE
ncbi:hypothetical protein [Paenibacillus terrigena]